MVSIPSVRIPRAVRQFVERPRLPRLEPFVPQADDPAIFWFNGERGDIVDSVSERITAEHAGSRRELELVLNDAAIHEMRRLYDQRDDEADRELGRWRSISRGIARMSDAEKRQTLHSVVHRFAEDVAGNFDPRVYRLATAAVPRLLTSLMEPRQVPKALMGGGKVLEQLLQVEGETEQLCKLQRQGTLVFVPTHSSNLDSIVLGRALEMAGLSPVVYGAGKNLFTNPIISFFMHNLGAYRVDRRVNASLYKEVLKTYSQVMVERGYHSLFFPGGTRSRSNLIENHLKLGLLGSAVSAYSENQSRGVQRKCLLRAHHHQLCLGVGGGDPGGRLAQSRGQSALHHRRRRVLTARPLGDLLPEAPRSSRRLRHPLRRSRRSFRQSSG